MSQEIFGLRVCDVAATKSVPSIIKKAMAFLDTMPIDEVLTSRGLSEKLNTTHHTLVTQGMCKVFERYKIKLHGKQINYYGHPKAIKKLRKAQARE